MFAQYENVDSISKNFLNMTMYSDYSIDNREFWEKVKSQKFIEYTTQNINDFSDFKMLTATMYMRFCRDGNRSEYDNEYHKRRAALVFYILLEAFENQSKYMDRIVDIVWMILDENTWALPAHGYLSREADALPQNYDYSVDLYAAETGSILCFAYAVLKERFNKISNNINTRILREVKERITDMYLLHNDYWWMGLENGGHLNNWNPWINSNILIVAPFVCTKEENNAIIFKVMKSLDKYITDYPDDGACDEGASYWFSSSLRFVEAIYFLYKYSAGTVDLRRNPKIKNMFRYIFDLYIGAGRVVSFADSSAWIYNNYGIICEMAEFLEDNKMKSFSYELMGLKRNNDIYDLKNPLRLLARLKVDTNTDKMKYEDVAKRSSYYESIEVMTESLDNGLFLAAKGGNNAESHNHNDIGNFIIYKNRIPFIIDTGNVSYTKSSFGNERYSIWTNVSQYHNLPTIGKMNQKDGKDYAASDIVYADKKFSVNIRNAYENRENIKYFVRHFDFSGENIKIKDEFQFKNKESVIFNFMCAVKPFLDNDMFVFTNSNETLKMKFEKNIFDIETEEIKHGDKNLENSWGDVIYRLKMSLKEKCKSGEIYWEFS